jgi:S-adenosylmethionine:tRNA ribosyltransferase-isomerase
MQPATRPVIASQAGRLLVVSDAAVSHLPRAAFPSLLHRDDLVIANDAATLPASLAGTHVPTGAPIEVRLAGRRSLDSARVDRFMAVVFGAGDYRTPTERRPMPPALAPGDQLRFVSTPRSRFERAAAPVASAPASRAAVVTPEATLVAHVVTMCGHPRLVEIGFSGTADSIWRWLATAGRPVQYAYVPEPLEIWDTWTRIAARPVAFESPSAGFILDWAMLEAIRERGARFATLTHAAGLSSTGDSDVDRRLPLDEPYEIPRSTSESIARTRAAGRRVIAVGTTVVRALESAVDVDGHVRPGVGLATLRLGPDSRLRVVDAVVSGMHEAGTSHYELLKAFADGSVLERMTVEAEAHGYLGHEFGDFVFVERTGDGGSEDGDYWETGSQTGKRGRTGALPTAACRVRPAKAGHVSSAQDPLRQFPRSSPFPRSSVCDPVPSEKAPGPTSDPVTSGDSAHPMWIFRGNCELSSRKVFLRESSADVG